EDGQEQEHVGQHSPDLEGDADGITPGLHPRGRHGAHEDDSIAAGRVILRRARAIDLKRRPSSANTATVDRIMMMRITACAAPRAQLSPVLNWVATIAPAMFPFAPPSTNA